jgi:hypothetical protein
MSQELLVNPGSRLCQAACHDARFVFVDCSVCSLPELALAGRVGNFILPTQQRNVQHATLYWQYSTAAFLDPALTTTAVVVAAEQEWQG